MNKKGKLYREAVAEMLKQGKIPPPTWSLGGCLQSFRKWENSRHDNGTNRRQQQLFCNSTRMIDTSNRKTILLNLYSYDEESKSDKRLQGGG